jgi:Flp pilus assembly protein TadG
MRLTMRAREFFMQCFTSMTRRSLRQFISGDKDGIRGVTAIEFAIIAPVLILMTICTIDLGIGFYRYLQVESAAGVGAQYAALNGFNVSNMKNAITNATSNSEISASPAPSTFCGCPSTTGITPMTAIAPPYCAASTCTGGAVAGTYVTASAQSPYSPIMNYPLLPSSFTLSAQSTMRIQ